MAEVQKVTNSITEYEQFFDALKEKAASFSGQAEMVICSVEKDFETLHAALDQRKNVLLTKIKEELSTPKTTDVVELSDRLRKMRALLRQLEQLAIQGSLSEDMQCYRDLIVELNQAKQKLKETSNKYQLKFESSLGPLVTEIATYGEIVSGFGGKQILIYIDFITVAVVWALCTQACQPR